MDALAALQNEASNKPLPWNPTPLSEKLPVLVWVVSEPTAYWPPLNMI
jgi:hypothetical protein